MLAVRPGHSNGLFSRLACDAPPLERREHLPPDLIDQFATPGALPVDDRPDPLAAGLEDNLAYPGRAFLCKPQEAGVALGNLFVALGAAQMPGHLRVTHQLLQERQVALAPRLETHGALVGPIALWLAARRHSSFLSGAAKTAQATDAARRFWSRAPSFRGTFLVRYIELSFILSYSLSPPNRFENLTLCHSQTRS